jgi:hypothetical protein
VALILIILALLGFGLPSYSNSHLKPFRMNCKARMSSGESRRNGCGGPPANP